MSEYYIGIDVGTGSARAGLFTADGSLVSSAVQEIVTRNPEHLFFEQSSTNIWESICKCVKSVVEESKVEPEGIKGLGFDATCSLVVVDEKDKSLPVNTDGNEDFNVIVWMDHRAIEEADFINSTNHGVLKYVGSTISPEMEIPKVLWLKKHHPSTYQKATHFFDLPDWLTYRATGSNIRSLCSTTCKMTYVDSQDGWNKEFFSMVGLDDLVSDNFARLGQKVLPMGTPVHPGLSSEAAAELGLKPGTAVGVSIIDAHAGGLGVIASDCDCCPEASLNTIDNRLALISGTSSCFMACSNQQDGPLFVKGVWGPYESAMIPGVWLAEGGQSASGALIDHVINSHGCGDAAKKNASAKGLNIYEYLNSVLEELQKKSMLHMLPYFHGNRSPRANPSLTGVVSGLILSNTIDDLALQYLTAIQSVAHGSRHIISTLNSNGFHISTVFVAGGLSKNKVFMTQLSDVTGCNLVIPGTAEPVLLGSAILAATASGKYSTVIDAMRGMTKSGPIVYPNQDDADYHNKKYKIFHKMYEHHQQIEAIMNE